MNPVEGLVVYLLIWWTTIFMVLPVGAKPPQEPAIGHAQSAPERPYLVWKFLANTVLAAFVWAGVDLMIRLELLDFWQWANEIPR